MVDGSVCGLAPSRRPAPLGIGEIATMVVLASVRPAHDPHRGEWRSAPWPDAITTALSLTAQVLLCRKRLENWWFWIAADLIYIPMYVARGLSLTALLYVVFLVLCVIGLRTWRAGLERRAEAARWRVGSGSSSGSSSRHMPGTVFS